MLFSAQSFIYLVAAPCRRAKYSSIDEIYEDLMSG